MDNQADDETACFECGNPGDGDAHGDRCPECGGGPMVRDRAAYGIGMDLALFAAESDPIRDPEALADSLKDAAASCPASLALGFRDTARGDNGE